VNSNAPEGYAAYAPLVAPVVLLYHPVIWHEWGKDKAMVATSGTKYYVYNSNTKKECFYHIPKVHYDKCMGRRPIMCFNIYPNTNKNSRISKWDDFELIYHRLSL
jgi:hypothetical protein